MSKKNVVIGDDLDESYLKGDKLPADGLLTSIIIGLIAGIIIFC